MYEKLLIGAGVLTLAACATTPRPEIRLLPQPLSVASRVGLLKLQPGAAIVVPPGDVGARRAAEWLAELSRRTVGRTLRIVEGGAGAIHLVRGALGAPSSSDESYAVEVTNQQATIEAGGDAGMLHGATTLWQLTARDGRIPAVSISDAPRFGWRGLMLDSARHPQSPEFIKTLIDAMAANKLNMLHWHLVDDQGWRIEIRKYPRLTQVGRTRQPATAPGAPPLPPVEGFYTQEQVRGIVAHAAKRGVTIVPEIEMPGHALSAIRAYPKLGTGVPTPAGVESHWGVFPWLYNVDDATFAFLEDVLTEVMELFPSRYIHVGGDEAVKDQWRNSPAVQARMRALGIKDEAQLQSWFINRMEKFLSARGRKLIGWDEILEGGIAPGATVMSWRGIDGAVTAARSGHDAVLSPAPVLYLDHLQSDQAEGPGRGGPQTLAQVYAFDPMPAALGPELRHHILGVQGNLWTEHARGDSRAAFQLFPRASAVAEIGWSASSRRDLTDFARRLAPQIERHAALGINGASSAFAPTAADRFDTVSGRVSVGLSNQTGLPMRYTLDGTPPGVKSPLYAGPFDLPLPTRVRAATYDGVRQMPGAFDRSYDAASVRRRSDRELRPCANKVPLALEDDAPATGTRASFLIDILEPCWIYPDAPLDGVTSIAIDVGQLPFNFQVGKDREGVRFRPPATAAGEFEVRHGGCAGERIAVLPMAPALGNSGVTRLVAPMTSRTGRADLCITYTARGVDPLWALGAVQLVTR